jgi:hypothetical protein
VRHGERSLSDGLGTVRLVRLAIADGRASGARAS